MTLLFGLDQWMAGTWAIPPAAGDSIKDVNGVTIAVGDTVKFVATVVAINPTDPHYGSIQVVGIHPNGEQVVPDVHFGNPQSPLFPVPNPLDKAKPYGFIGLQLVVGS